VQAAVDDYGERPLGGILPTMADPQSAASALCARVAGQAVAALPRRSGAEEIWIK
jgi:hypothetical protein